MHHDTRELERLHAKDPGEDRRTMRRGRLTEHPEIEYEVLGSEMRIISLYDVEGGCRIGEIERTLLGWDERRTAPEGSGAYERAAAVAGTAPFGSVPLQTAVTRMVTAYLERKREAAALREEVDDWIGTSGRPADSGQGSSIPAAETHATEATA